MKKPTTTQKNAGLSVGTAALLWLSGLVTTEHYRDKVANTLGSSKAGLGEVQDTSLLSHEEKTLRVKIQTKYYVLSKNIENNKRFHGFWSIGKLPGYWNTDNDLREIQKTLESDASIKDLRKADSKLKILIEEFHDIMQNDEDEILREIEEGIAHISDDDIAAIQGYMAECLLTIKEELTIGDVSADYTGTQNTTLQGTLEDFINETDNEKAKADLRKLINNYTYAYTEEDSKLAFHHLAEIAERLKSGDSWSEAIAKVTVTGGSILLLLLVSYIVIKKFGLPSLKIMGRRLGGGLFFLLLELIGERKAVRKKRKMDSTPPPLTDIVEKESEIVPETSASPLDSAPITIDVAGEIVSETLETSSEGGKSEEKS